MLFNSYQFIFLFLPISLVVFHLLGRLPGQRRLAICWLAGMSLLFYAVWNPAYLGLMLASIMFNYAVGYSLGKKQRKKVLAFGIIVNIALLCYYKYANFFVDNVNTVFDLHIHLDPILLPLAISFFTFQQITFLIDAYDGAAREYNFIQYCLFVTFFPHLIAGPIVHHKEMMPQFARIEVYRIRMEHFVPGLTLFIFGLFKKVVLADAIALHATPVFAAADQGAVLTLFEAWGGALAYTLQLYFDFSGYSDMALGIARMFGIRLPVNFNSPYKSENIIEFWRSWHMTLSRFLRNYIYIPLGGNKKGKARRYANLMITMLLGGLWHGAGWTYVAWGGLHGLYLVINNAWLSLRKKLFGGRKVKASLAEIWICRLITFTAVVLAWVMFRAKTWKAAIIVYKGMIGLGGISLPPQLSRLDHILSRFHVTYDGFGTFGGNWAALQIVILMGIVWFLPNTQQIMRRYKVSLMPEKIDLPRIRAVWLEWRPNAAWALVVGLAAAMSILNLSKISEFLYFQF